MIEDKNEMLEFVKGLYRSCYDNLCLAEKVRIPVGEYMGEEGEKRYRELLKEMVCGVEELEDMLCMMGEERMREKEKGE